MWDVICLIIVGLVLFIAFGPEEEEEIPNDYRSLKHCIGKHTWITKGTENKYIVCSICSYLPESGGYEP